jgi:hypothetical protein
MNEDTETVDETINRLQAENERLRAREEEALNGEAAAEYRARQAEVEVERLRAAFSRYGDHDRACDARENALYACTCGFVDRVNELFPSRNALAEEKSRD